MYFVRVIGSLEFGIKLDLISVVGKLPKNQVSSQQVETYMAEERGKRRVLLHKFIDKCSVAKVQ